MNFIFFYLSILFYFLNWTVGLWLYGRHWVFLSSLREKMKDFPFVISCRINWLFFTPEKHSEKLTKYDMVFSFEILKNTSERRQPTCFQSYFFYAKPVAPNRFEYSRPITTLFHPPWYFKFRDFSLQHLPIYSVARRI